MLSIKLLIVLAIGTVLMWIPMAVQSSWYKIPIWKSVPAAILLTISGTLGTYIWYFIENYGVGRSFYGAVFLVPVFFILTAKILYVPYAELLDLCAPAECVMLSIMKIQCLVDGCCGGKVLFTTLDNIPVYFPSQMVEMGNAIILFGVLMIIAHRGKYQRVIYPIYMILYGGSRFILNYFRAGTSPFLIGLSAGSFWSLCSVIVGIILVYIYKRKSETV